MLVRSMRSKIILLVGLSIVLVSLSVRSISYVNGEQGALNNSSFGSQTDNANSGAQTNNLDPFTKKGSDNSNVAENSNDASSTDQGTNDKDSTNDNNKDSTNDKDSKSIDSSEHKHSESNNDGKSFELPFP